jgi:hypothetical protein
LAAQAALPFEAVNDGMRVMKAPKAKLPYIVDDDGTVVADTTFIIEHLQRRRGITLDAALTPAERAVATAFQRLSEENLYWAVVHTRWIDDAGWVRTREAFFGMLPVPLRWFVPAVARRGLRVELRGHADDGLAGTRRRRGRRRHTADQRDGRGREEPTPHRPARGRLLG